MNKRATIKLLAMAVSNFKGLRSHTFRPDGRSAEVRGDNAAGKTSLHDAWCWLWTGKDSTGRVDFSIKTIGAESADHIVDAEVDIDGSVVRLSRTLREKWTKKRGAAASDLTGHTTEYAIDGVPMQEKEWLARLAEYAPATTWRLVSSPTAFAALHWQERRAILTGLCGDASDAEVMASTPDLAGLMEILGKRTPDEHRRVITARRKEAKQLLDQIPPRLDELARSMAGVDGLNRAALTSRAAEVAEQLADAKAGAGDGELRRDRAAGEAKRCDLAARRKAERDDALRSLRSRLSDAQSAMSTAQRRAQESERLASECEGNALRFDADATRLREEFRRAATPVAHIDGLCQCAACGDAHTLAPERLAEVRADANVNRAARLAVINARGREAKEKAAGHREWAQRAAGEAAGHQNALAAATRDARTLTDQIATAAGEAHPLDDQIAELAATVARLDEQIRLLEEGVVDIKPLLAEQATANAGLAKLDAALVTSARMAELAAEQKKLGAEWERLERELWLLDRFAQAQAEVTEARVNKMFSMARFRLFRPQINGGVEQCSDILVDGVPYGSGLNRGAEINCGLDIVRVLGQHLGVMAPVFVDNAEAVVELLDSGTQTIRLVVDGAAKGLEVTCD